MAVGVSAIWAQNSLPARTAWLVGGCSILIFYLRDFLQSDAGLIANSVFWGRDFINVWTGGQLVREGRVEILYDLHAYADYQRALFGNIGPHNYSYPPITFPIAALFSLLPYPVSLAFWLCSTGALFIWAARPWWPKDAGPTWLAVLTPAALVNIWAGHYGFLIGALFLFGWRNLDERPLLAGVFFGLMLIKPHLAALVPLALLIRRDWTAILSAAMSAMVLIASTTLWFGWEPWQAFLFRTTGVQASMIDAGSMFFGMMSTSTATAVLRVGGSWPVAFAVQALFSLSAIAMVAVAASRRVETQDLALLTATATFLLLPYAFNYDMTVVMIGALVILSRPNVGPGNHRMAFYGFVAPQVGMVLSAFYVPLMPLMIASLAIAQFRLALARAPRPSSTRLVMVERCAA